MYFIFLVAGLASIFWLFDQIETKKYQEGMTKHGPEFRPKLDWKKIGYVVMFAYFAALSMSFSGSIEGPGSDYDPCGSSMKC